jgi:hypothetical protein
MDTASFEDWIMGKQKVLWNGRHMIFHLFSVYDVLRVLFPRSYILLVGTC